jgi:hypothetical protein
MRAGAEEGLKEIAVEVVKDFHRLDPRAFWATLERRGWRRLFDGHGHRRGCREILTSVDQLQDDLLRGLAAALRRAGVIASDGTLFGEFVSADLLRQQMSDADFATAPRTVCIAEKAGGLGSAPHPPRLASQLAAVAETAERGFAPPHSINRGAGLQPCSRAPFPSWRRRRPHGSCRRS